MEKTETEINKWRESLKQEAREASITITMHKQILAYKFMLRAFNMLKTGEKISKKKLYEMLPYNMALLSKAKTKARKHLPEQIGLKELVQLCLCIKSPQDYMNLYLFELLNYPKDEYDAFKLGTTYIYTFGSDSIDIVLPTNILKGALKLHYDISAVINHSFLSESKDYIQYEIESKKNSMRFDLVFYITTEEKNLKYVKEYHERYHMTNSDRIFADKLEESYLKLNGTALTVFDFGDNFSKSSEANADDIMIMINMLMNALMFSSKLRYKYILQLFEKDLNDRVSQLKYQIDNTSSNKVYYQKILDTYEKKKSIQNKFTFDNSIKRMFDIKEQCYNDNELYIIELDELIRLFIIDDRSEIDKRTFKEYLLGLGFSNKLYAWHQISEMISYYYGNDKLKNVLDEYYRYLEKNYTIVIQMKDTFMTNAYPDGSKDYDLYIPTITNAKDKIINEQKYQLEEKDKHLEEKDKQLEVLTDIIRKLEISNKKLKRIYQSNYYPDDEPEQNNKKTNEENITNDIPVLEVQTDSDEATSCSDDEFEFQFQD